MIGVNLIPPAIQAAQARRGHVRAWTTATVIAAALTCIPITMNWVESVRAASMSEQGEAVRQELAQLRSLLRQLTAEVQDATLQLDRARSLRSKRAWSALLAVIGRALPERCWLASIATDPVAPATGMRTIERKARPARSGPAAADADPDVVHIVGPRALRISGFATDPSDPLAFVTRLKETELFRTVNLESFRSESTSSGPAPSGADRNADVVFRFDLICEW